GISFTGSVETGRKIAKLSGKNLKKLVLELGGSDPFIVLEDADLNLACNGGVSSRFKNCGQACNAAKRFILVETIANEFIKKFVEITENLKVGDPLDENTQMGPLASKEQLTKIEGQVNDAIAKGAKVLTGGKKLAGKGYFFQPTVLTQVTREMKVLKEEVFGPVAPMVVVKNEREAIRKANDTEFGLGASIWSKDEEKAEKLAKEVDAGTVFINKVVSSNPKLPFGGVKQSGIGREMARYGLLEFTNIKPIVIG
ncbi:MAG: aldehyde dehydrogenase family protein, partial [Methanosarcinales archaeon]